MNQALEDVGCWRGEDEAFLSCCGMSNEEACVVDWNCEVDVSYEDTEILDSAAALPSIAVWRPATARALPATPDRRHSLRRKLSQLRRVSSTIGKLSLDDFEFVHMLGRGSFATVVLVRKRDAPDRRRLFAMKCLGKATAERVRAERRALASVDRCPFVASLRYAFQSDVGLYMLTEFWDAGSLAAHIPPDGMTLERARFHAAELVLALKHVHDKYIVHRDVKPSNVLVDARGHVALADFGLCAPDVTPCAAPLATFCGSIEYMAPEILRGNKYGHAVDWWAFGALVFELVHGATPFFHAEPKQLFTNIIKAPPNFRRSLPEALAYSLRQWLCKDPHRRCGYGAKAALDVQSSPFLFDVDWPRMAVRAIPPPYEPRLSQATLSSSSCAAAQSLASIEASLAAADMPTSAKRRISPRRASPTKAAVVKRFSYSRKESSDIDDSGPLDDDTGPCDEEMPQWEVAYK